MLDKTKDMLDVEARFDEPVEKVIPRMFKEHRTTQDVADAMGISRATLYNWCRQFGIATERGSSVVETP